MNHPHLTLVDGTSALSLGAQVEAELAKDRWDARRIPGFHYAPHTGNNYVNFLPLPELFRPVVKDYARCLLAAGRGAGGIDRAVSHLGHFFAFFLERYPGIQTLQPLCEQDIDAFIVRMKADAQGRGVQHLDRFVYYGISSLDGLLSHLERLQHPMKPLEPLSRIIWPHHYPKNPFSKAKTFKHIPQTVLIQLETHLHHLTPTYIPVVILLRASGWRISDVLYLKLGTCLEQDNDHYWLVGDIQKTRVLGHKIPITAEIAAVVQAQKEWVEQTYTSDENPKRWLFPASKKASHRFTNSQRFWSGEPLQANAINQVLNTLAVKYQITDEQGGIFHFRSHAFRHTKAVELINNGMSLLLVQQWMAHASPEMTLIYARILDETMRQAWEKTVKQGIVQFNEGKPEFVPGKKMLPMSGANSFDPERVRDHRQNIKMALGSCLKTAKIMCKFVELPCFHCPAYVLTPDDLPALEVYEQQILERIGIGQQAGNAHWIEVNQKNLEERVRPAIVLLKQGQIVAKTDKYEREYSDEEWEQHHQHDLEPRT